MSEPTERMLLRKIERILVEDTNAEEHPCCGWGPLLAEVRDVLGAAREPTPEALDAILAEARREGELAMRGRYSRWQEAAKDVIDCFVDPYGRGRGKDWNAAIRELIEAERALD